jgi:hypothetical protein
VAATLIAVSGIVWLLLRGPTESRLRTLAASTATLASILLGVSSLVFYVSYRPYASLLEHFLTVSETPRDLKPLFVAFASLYTFPAGFWQMWWQHSIQIYFWYVLIATGSIVAVWLLARNTWRMVARHG